MSRKRAIATFFTCESVKAEMGVIGEEESVVQHRPQHQRSVPSTTSNSDLAIPVGRKAYFYFNFGIRLVRILSYEINRRARVKRYVGLRRPHIKIKPLTEEVDIKPRNMLPARSPTEKDVE